ncbi:MAG TPA: SBBP repeat-containing protein [Thermoanaerobaculia bacterium]|nr:SBBP repeat-containing protein [Thermoanaerobaculia bacterium]
MKATRKISWLAALAVALGLGAAPLQAAPSLAWSTYLGGGILPWYGEGIAVDAAGNTFVANGGQIAKIGPRGELVFTATLAGVSIGGIAVDAAGGIYLTGSASWRDAFAARLDPSGSQIVFSRTFGGSGSDWGEKITVDSQGFVYVTGTSESADFPSVHPVSLCHSEQDAFAVKLAPDGALVYSTCLGGSDRDFGAGIAADDAGHAYVVGTTGSGDLPTVNPIQGRGGTYDGFVAKILPDGGGLVYLTWLGGNQWDFAEAVAVDPEGNAYVTGSTESANFPILGGIRTRNTSEAGIPVDDAFVTVLSPSGSLTYSTYLGGAWYDRGTGIGLDAAGMVYVAGGTTSFDFPVRDALQEECYRPDEDMYYCDSMAFVTRLDLASNEIVFSTFLGGYGNFHRTEARALAVDPWGNLSLAGWTNSSSFPLVNPIQPSPTDGFLARIAFNLPPDCSTAQADPATLWPLNGRMVPVSILGVTDPEGEPVELRVTAIHQDEPLSKKGEPDSTGLGTATPRLRADRAGSGNGRVYHIAFEATAPAGATCTGTVTVCVPHDRGKPACGDGGPLVDSTGAP